MKKRSRIFLLLSMGLLLTFSGRSEEVYDGTLNISQVSENRFTLSIVNGGVNLVGAKAALPVQKTHSLKTSQLAVKIAVGHAQKEIIGTWVREDDATNKLVFNSLGIMKEYTNDIEDSSSNYVITTSCDGKTYDSGSGPGLYLKTKDVTESSWICQYIRNINHDGGVLSLGSPDRWLTVVYLKQ